VRVTFISVDIRLDMPFMSCGNQTRPSRHNSVEERESHKGNEDGFFFQSEFAQAKDHAGKFFANQLRRF
jgi:hypothetical protein